MPLRYSTLNSFFWIFGSSLLLSGCSLSTNQTATSVTSALATKDFLPGIAVVYTSNVNGEVEPCGCRSNPTGGIDRKWNLFQSEKLNPSNSLVVDSGDLFYQTNTVPPFLKEQWDLQGKALLESYNSTGCDAFAPGEMDFASGLETFMALKKESHFPFLSANIKRSDSDDLLLDEFIILEKNGTKVALFGLYDEALELPPELEALPHLEVAKKLVPRLRKKANVVIALTHLGLEKDEELARQVEGIDGIFGGHTQSFLQNPIKIGDTLIFQTSFRNQHLGIYKNGTNRLVALDTTYDTPDAMKASHPMATLMARTKLAIAEINKKSDASLLPNGTPGEAPQATGAMKLQTFVRCAECHQSQYNFYKKTKHASAFQTLISKKQNFNKECLQCHTLGMNQPQGWQRVDELILNASGKHIPAEFFAKSLPLLPIKNFDRYSKTYINVQCEHCHGAGGDHPWGGKLSTKTESSKCLACHTSVQAPLWYQNGKPNEHLIRTKIKSIACPR